MSCWADVRKSQQRLKEFCSSSTKDDIKSSLEDLSSCLTLLELSAPSSASLERLKTHFRYSFSSLYVNFPVQMLPLCVEIINALVEDKINTTARNGQSNMAAAWKKVEASLFNGLIDSLESDSSGRIKKAIATYLYPVLCPKYFPGSPLSIGETSVQLLSSVNSLLSESASDFAENQRKLREAKVLGGDRLGRALSQTQDYLVTESILVLFATLLPAMKSGKKKRNDFIKSVFSPELFPNSEDLVALVVSAASQEWEVTSENIVKALAATSITYPQPFCIESFSFQNSDLQVHDAVFMDKIAFVCNVEHNGVFDTLQIPFTSIVKMIFPSPSQPDPLVSLIFELDAPPLLGDSPYKAGNSSTITLSFSILGGDLGRLVRGLRLRGQERLVPSLPRKMSKIHGSVTLEFDPSGKSLSTKANQILDFGSPADKNTTFWSAGQSDERMLDNLELSAEDTEDFEEALPPKRAIKVARKKIVESDDEIMEVSPPSAGKTPSEPVSWHSTNIDDVPDMSNTAGLLPTTPPSRKRQRDNHGQNTLSDDAHISTLDAPPIKRLRTDVNKALDQDWSPSVKQKSSALFAVTPLIAAKRYGRRKGRASSLEVSSVTDDFDALPAPRSKVAAKKHQNSPPPHARARARARASVATGRGGKTPMKGANNKDTVTQTGAKSVARFGKKEATSNDPRNLADDEPKIPRRSSRVTKTVDVAKNTIVPVDDNDPRIRQATEKKSNPVDEKRLKKPKNAPWENEECKKELPANSESNDGVDLIFTELPFQEPGSGIDLSACDDFEYVDYSESVKKESSEETQDITMIDLTRESPPIARTQRERDPDHKGSTVVVNSPTSRLAPVEQLRRQTGPSDGIAREISHAIKEIVPTSVVPLEQISSKQPLPPTLRETFSTPTTPSNPGTLTATQDVGLPRFNHLQDTLLLDVKPDMKDTSASRTYTSSSNAFLPHRTPSSVENDPSMLRRPTHISPVTPGMSTALSSPLFSTEASRYNLKGPISSFDIKTTDDVTVSASVFRQLSEPPVPHSSTPRKIYPAWNSPLLKSRRVSKAVRFSVDNETPRDGVLSNIVNVLGQIQDMLVTEFSDGCARVKTDVRLGRDALLQNVVEDMERMRHKSADYFTCLVDLQAGYAMVGRDVTNSWDEIINATAEISQELDRKLLKHDRNCLSKQFPQSFGSLPASILEPTRL